MEAKTNNYAKRVKNMARQALKNGEVTERCVRSTHGKTAVSRRWGDRWSDSEIKKVEMMRKQGKAIAEIALALGRSIVSIQSRKWATPLARKSVNADKRAEKQTKAHIAFARALAKK